ncbi:ubiquitin carboxyl-terminal hydrolase 47-like [Copidosoma floridanum]|uniref:ubiquitin carboxyl-terminal hydrolase 47-like n=1 Tax=Copidosoma floridanum TaxID=29053 RepID=UPI0006C96C0B|nr:ubiquitin carboxyl-terminal hydrolase 47-like [Copidosoma floridanum]
MKTYDGYTIQGKLVGLRNIGNSCYINVIVQSLFWTPEFRNQIFCHKNEDGNNIILELQKLFTLLQINDDTALPTSFIKTCGWESPLQEDAQELYLVVLRKLYDYFAEKSLKNTIEDLYEGHIQYSTTCLTCRKKCIHHENFLDISLPVIDASGNSFASLKAALTDFMKPEVMQHYCKECDETVYALKEQLLTQEPYVLIIHLKRFNYDQEKKQNIKLENRLLFPAFLSLHGIQRNLGKSQPCVDNIETDSYELFSIIIHDGNASEGYYYAFIKDLETKVWICFNDESVTLLPTEEINYYEKVLLWMENSSFVIENSNNSQQLMKLPNEVYYSETLLKKKSKLSKLLLLSEDMINIDINNGEGSTPSSFMSPHKSDSESEAVLKNDNEEYAYTALVNDNNCSLSSVVENPEVW